MAWDGALAGALADEQKRQAIKHQTLADLAGVQQLIGHGNDMEAAALQRQRAEAFGQKLSKLSEAGIPLTRENVLPIAMEHQQLGAKDFLANDLGINKLESTKAKQAAAERYAIERLKQSGMKMSAENEKRYIDAMRAHAKAVDETPPSLHHMLIEPKPEMFNLGGSQPPASGQPPAPLSTMPGAPTPPSGQPTMLPPGTPFAPSATPPITTPIPVQNRGVSVPPQVMAGLAEQNANVPPNTTQGANIQTLELQPNGGTLMPTQPLVPTAPPPSATMPPSSYAGMANVPQPPAPAAPLADTPGKEQRKYNRDLAMSQSKAAFANPEISPSDLAASSARVAAGEPLTQVVPGNGRGQPTLNRQKVREGAIELIKSQNPGMTDTQAGYELANKTIEFTAGKKTVGQLTTMLGASRQAVQQLDFNVNKVTQIMDELSKTESLPTDLSPIVTAIERGVEKWTGDPKYSALYYYMNAAAMESARLLQGGQASVAQLHAGAAEEARKWANTNWTTPKSWKEGAAPAIMEEGRYRVKTYEDAIKAQQLRPNGASAQPPSQTGPVKISSDAEYEKLVPGTSFVGPDGKTRKKP